jgi:hypothetical protein
MVGSCEKERMKSVPLAVRLARSAVEAKVLGEGRDKIDRQPVGSCR